MPNSSPPSTSTPRFLLTRAGTPANGGARRGVRRAVIREIQPSARDLGPFQFFNTQDISANNTTTLATCCGIEPER